MLYYEVRRVPTPKWMLPRVCFVLTDIASPVDQTGEAFLFLLVSLIEKGKKRYNQTSKGNEQAQNTYNYRNNLKSCHYNAPPFLCNPANWRRYWEAATLSWALQCMFPCIFRIPYIPCLFNRESNICSIYFIF